METGGLAIIAILRIVPAACTDSRRASTPNYQALEADSSGQEVIRLATRKIGESAITGRFMSVKAAQSPANKKTAIVRTIKSPSKPKGKK
jgi:hypothetical protein